MAYFRSVSDSDEDDEEYLRFDPLTDYSDNIHPDMPDADYFRDSGDAVIQDSFSKVTGFNRPTSIHISRDTPRGTRRRRPDTQREGHLHHQGIVDEAVRLLAISTEEQFKSSKNSCTETPDHWPEFSSRLDTTRFKSSRR